MRPFILAGLVAATLAPVAAQAQPYYGDRGELRHDRRELRDDRRDLRDDRRELRRDRQEYRADAWRDWRRQHPDYYRAGRWDGPRGYAYRPVGVGYRFNRDFYDRRYWIDPYRYHLRTIGPRDRWVRYGPDVVRIDTVTGRVVEVNRGFFF